MSLSITLAIVLAVTLGVAGAMVWRYERDLSEAFDALANQVALHTRYVRNTEYDLRIAHAAYQELNEDYGLVLADLEAARAEVMELTDMLDAIVAASSITDSVSYVDPDVYADTYDAWDDVPF